MNYTICGMAGAGKSYLLKKIEEAYKLLALSKLVFIDLDSFIEKKTNCPIETLIKDEPYFREMESIYLKEILDKEDQMIALGGGSLIRNKNLIKNGSFLIYLDTPFEKCFERIKRSNRFYKDLNYQESLKIYNSRIDDFKDADMIVRFEDNSNLPKNILKVLNLINIKY